MAIYLCNECGRMRDDDYDGCFDDPRNGPNEFELLCEDCIGEVEEELIAEQRVPDGLEELEQE